MVPDENGQNFTKDHTWVPCSIALDANGNCGTQCKERCRRKANMTRNFKNNTLNERKYKGQGTSTSRY